MRIFKDEKSSYDSKVNFVDKNDVFVGYDTEESCCEDFGWFISETANGKYLEVLPELDDYIFDKKFFETFDSYEAEDEGGTVVFKLTSKNKGDLYLHLYNHHNGYYCHNFIVKHSGKVIMDRYL